MDLERGEAVKMRNYKRKYKLPPLEENERIYFDVAYEVNGLARYCHCGYDENKKLWFTGCHNANLKVLSNAYKINENTSEKAMKQLEEALKK